MLTDNQNQETLNRYKGCLLGLAIGDALGTTLEFCPPGTFTPITDMVGGGPFNLEAGYWTDDTSMALCLADSLLECNGFDPNDQMARYVRWWHEGYRSSTGKCFDIGNTVRTALAKYLHTQEPYSGLTEPYTAGNGSIMRLAPVPMYYANQPQLAVTMAGQSSKTTHAVDSAVDACRYMAGLIVGLLNGLPKDVVLASDFSPIAADWKQNPLCPKIAAIANGSFKHKQPPEIKGTGYVVESLEAALWAFYQSSTFVEGCLKAVNLGDDADTTGAVYGQIAGAFYGVEGIPKHWLEKLVMKHQIEDLAIKLYEVSAKNSDSKAFEGG